MKYLLGKSILLTRSVAQNKATAKLVTEAGAKPVLFPCLDITYLTSSIQQGLNQLQQSPLASTDVIFSSSNGVLALAQTASNLATTLADYRIVAIGKKTAAALQSIGCPAHIIPDKSSQLGLIQAYQSQPLPKQVFFFRAQEGSDSLCDFFKQQHIPCTLIASYQSGCLQEDATAIIQQLQQDHVDAVLLASARTAAFYVQRIGDITLANKPAIAVISPQVAEAADKLGLSVQVVARDTSFKAMLDGLNQYFAHKE